MWKLLFLAVAFTLSVSPLDAAPRQDEKKVDKRERAAELRRDVERISKEIYPPRGRERQPRR